MWHVRHRFQSGAGRLRKRTRESCRAAANTVSPCCSQHPTTLLGHSVRLRSLRKYIFKGCIDDPQLWALVGTCWDIRKSHCLVSTYLMLSTIQQIQRWTRLTTHNLKPHGLKTAPLCEADIKTPPNLPKISNQEEMLGLELNAENRSVVPRSSSVRWTATKKMLRELSGEFSVWHWMVGSPFHTFIKQHRTTSPKDWTLLHSHSRPWNARMVQRLWQKTPTLL